MEALSARCTTATIERDSLIAEKSLAGGRLKQLKDANDAFEEHTQMNKARIAAITGMFFISSPSLHL